MRTQEKMFGEVENWLASGETKARFLEGKAFSAAKFNYWVAKWKAHEQMGDDVTDGFREVNFSDVKLGKVLEIEAPSGVRITVFA
jgi:hypothetical protein